MNSEAIKTNDREQNCEPKAEIIEGNAICFIKAVHNLLKNNLMKPQNKNIGSILSFMITER